MNIVEETAHTAGMIDTDYSVNSSKDALPIEAFNISDELLLSKYLTDYSYQDGFAITVDAHQLLGKASADNELTLLMSRLLDGFMHNQADHITQIMNIRNLLVKPLKLRTSSVGCPVSSLLDSSNSNLFADSYPVLDSSVTDTMVQVLLGADDKHLRFRSCVAIKKNSADDSISKRTNASFTISLSTRVTTKNWFGKFYMLLVNPVHTRYIEPRLLADAVNYLLKS